MSVSSGRMSRTDAQAILSAMQPSLREFSAPDASPELLEEVAALSVLRAALQDSIDRGDAPDAPRIRSLRASLASMQWNRFLNSQQQDPRHTLAAVITLYGQQADEMETAAALAERDLGCPVRLQDSLHVRTATLTGTRYIFLPAAL
jgi:hypothetical protein